MGVFTFIGFWLVMTIIYGKENWNECIDDQFNSIINSHINDL